MILASRPLMLLQNYGLRVIVADHSGSDTARELEMSGSTWVSSASTPRL
jgi:hypothetical protein